MGEENNSKRTTTVLDVFKRISSGLSNPPTAYVTILALLIVFSLTISTSKVQKSFFDSGLCKSDKDINRCSSVVGYGGVYRTFLAHALFQLVLAVLTSEVWVFTKWREKLHRELWSIKILVLSVSVVLCLLIPNGTVLDNIISYFGFLCGSTFIIVQMLSISGLTQRGINYLVPDVDTLLNGRLTSARFLLYHLLVSILHLFSLLLLIYFFLLFANQSVCLPNLIFLSYVLSHFLLISVLAFIPRIRNEHSQKGIPQTLSCLLYTIFISWLAMCSDTRKACNPYINGVTPKYPGTDGNAFLSLAILLVFLCHFAYDTALVLGELKRFSTCEVHVEWVNPKSKHSSESPTEEFQQKIDEQLDQKKISQTSYNYGGLHMSMFLVSFYVMTSITNWQQPDVVSSHVTYRKSRVAMFVLMAATFICLWVYTWILIRPVVLDKFCKKLKGVNGSISRTETKESTSIVASSPQRENRSNVIQETVGDNFVENVVSSKIPNSQAMHNLPNMEHRQTSGKEVDDPLGDKIILSEREKEMIRLQEKVLRLQEKIGKLQYKVSVLQGVSL